MKSCVLFASPTLFFIYARAHVYPGAEIAPRKVLPLSVMYLRKAFVRAVEREGEKEFSSSHIITINNSN